MQIGENDFGTLERGRKGFSLKEKVLHYAKVRRKVFSSKEKYLHYAKVRRKGEEKDLIS